MLQCSYSNFKRMIDLILVHRKSMLNLIEYPRNWLNMVTSTIQAGSLELWRRVRLSNPHFVGTASDSLLHGTLLPIQQHPEYKSQRIFVFAETVVSVHFDQLRCVTMLDFDCVDRATKLIAKIRQCDILVRDTNRIHHFYRNGHCSCQDYFWNKSTHINLFSIWSHFRRFSSVSRRVFTGSWWSPLHC